MTKPRKINIFSIIFSILIDFALIGMGMLLYYHFQVYPLGIVDLSPIFINLFGSKEFAVLVISGVPILVGVFNLLRTLLHMAKKILVSIRPG